MFTNVILSDLSREAFAKREAKNLSVLLRLPPRTRPTLTSPSMGEAGWG